MNCMVCNRPLRAPRSVRLRVGPVCAKKVAQVGAAVRERMQTDGTWGPTAQSHYRPGEQGWFELAAQARLINVTARAQRLAERVRMRQEVSSQTLQSQEPIIVQSYSVSRRRNETLSFQNLNESTAECTSESGHVYAVTEDSCTCPHHSERWQVCRHMEAFRQLRGVSEGQDNSAPVIVQNIHENTPDLSALDSPEDQYREQQLQIWRAYNPEPTEWLSQDEAAWRSLYEEAGGDLSYRYENVLGGVETTFGVEIEFEDGDIERIGNELYREGILCSPHRDGYHSTSAPGMWKFERDGSVSTNYSGGEIVSPVLVDSRTSWEQLKFITEVVKRHGGRATSATGGHIHIGMNPLDDRAYRWQRLARIGLGYEKMLFRMGAANDEAFQQGRYGTHRGTSYAHELPDSARQLYGESLTADQARRLLVDHQRRGSSARYTAFNTTKYIEFGVPTVEFRYPNGTLDPRQIQAQVQVTNALMFQSAVLRQDTAQGKLMPGLSKRAEQYRVSERYSEDEETKGFRKFLDLLGNRDIQLAATWLWRRGRA